MISKFLLLLLLLLFFIILFIIFKNKHVDNYLYYNTIDSIEQNINTNSTDYTNFYDNDMDDSGLINVNDENNHQRHFINDDYYNKSLKYNPTRYNKSNKSRINLRGSKYT